MSFGKKIKLLLKDEGISQRILAEEIEMNYTQMSNYISGYNKPNFEFVEKIIRRFPRVDLNWLLRDHEVSDIVSRSNGAYSKPETPENLIAEITSKLEKLKHIVSQK